MDSIKRSKLCIVAVAVPDRDRITFAQIELGKIGRGAARFRRRLERSPFFTEGGDHFMYARVSADEHDVEGAVRLHLKPDIGF